MAILINNESLQQQFTIFVQKMVGIVIFFSLTEKRLIQKLREKFVESQEYQYDAVAIPTDNHTHNPQNNTNTA